MIPFNRGKQGAAGVLLLLCGGVALWYLPRVGRAQQEIAPPVPTPVTGPLATAAEQDVPLFYEATGTVRPQFASLLAARVMGRVQEVRFHEGDRVRTGQTLIELDARDLDTAVSQADAGLRAAKVGLAAAAAAANREVAVSRAQIAQASAELARSEAALEVARVHRDRAKAGPRRQEREQADQAVKAAKAGLDLAETTLRRMTDLFQKEAIARQQLDQTQAQYDLAKAGYEQAVLARSIADEGTRTEDIRSAGEEVRQAEAGVLAATAAVELARANALQIAVRRQEVRLAQERIGQADAGVNLSRITRGFATVSAPYDGVLARRLVDPGALVNPGTPLLEIQGGTLRLEATVPESVLSSVRVGATISLRFDAPTAREVVGRVIEIAPQGDAVSHLFPVKIAIPGKAGLSAGMFGRAKFPIGIQKRLTIPQTAVFEREGLRFVSTVDSERKPHLRMVTVGQVMGDRIEVLSGLSVGETVTLTPSFEARERRGAK